jgi:DNA-binding NarL/FixJ family response regulator
VTGGSIFPAVTDRREVRRISVVVCDDVPDLRSILHDLLAEEPSILILGEADNGRACLELVRRLEPDVVLLDVLMPVMDGFEVIPAIIRDAPQTGIIVISGCDVERMGEAAIRLGADRYIEKSAALHQLAAAVVEVGESRLARAPGR